MKYLAAFLLFTLSATSLAEDFRIDGIQVLDEQFIVIRSIDSIDELSWITAEWKKLIEIESVSSEKLVYKIDIDSDDIGGRWLYGTEGYLVRLNKELSPKYRVGNVKRFNEIILGL